MERKHERPEWLKTFERPAGTEIKFINGHWYLYERFCVYDKVRHQKHKKSGKLLGTITPDGLRPPKREFQVIKHNAVWYNACYARKDRDTLNFVKGTV